MVNKPPSAVSRQTIAGALHGAPAVFEFLMPMARSEGGVEDDMWLDDPMYRVTDDEVLNPELRNSGVENTTQFILVLGLRKKRWVGCLEDSRVQARQKIVLNGDVRRL